MAVTAANPLQVNREYVLECFLDSNPVLKESVVYSFEAVGQDTVGGVLGAELHVHCMVTMLL